MNSHASAEHLPHIGARFRTAEPPPPPPVRVNWSMVGVLVAIAVQSVGIVWWAAGMDRRVTSLEQANPPGVVARIDERTASMRESLDRLDRRLEHLENSR